MQELMIRGRLEESLDLASLDVDIDVEVSRCRGKTGDGLDVGCQSIPEIFVSLIMARTSGIGLLTDILHQRPSGRRGWEQ